MQQTDNPRYTVVLEGYNESRDLGTAWRFLTGLKRQTVDLQSVQVVLVGTASQVEGWTTEFAGESAFHSMEFLPADGVNYYGLKNTGARAALGEIVVMADTDTIPEAGWLAAIGESIDDGADVTAGVSRFFSDSETRWPGWMLDLAASISWGFILGEKNGQYLDARGFLSHNVGFRRAVLERQLFPEEFGRTCGGSFLFTRLRAGGARFTLNPRQRSSHAFSFRWWTRTLHARFGYEVYRLRRLGSTVVSGEAARLGWLEPAMTMFWHVAVDVPQWLRYGKIIGWGAPARVAALPVLLLLSMAARGSEMIAMHRTIASPEAMEEFALRS
ncbi:MAG: glycosyltransferase [Bryobacteraceae bacterium]